MIQFYRPTRGRFTRPTALLLSLSMAMPLALIGCGGNKGNDIPPPVDSPAVRSSGGGAMAPTRPGGNGGMAPNGGGLAPPQHTGITTKQKVVVLAGAALLYYLYKKHQKETGETVQYYQSKNGRIYYRDPKTHQAMWVTPQTNYQLSDEEAQDVGKYQGYNGSATGQTYGSPDTAPQPQ